MSGLAPARGRPPDRSATDTVNDEPSAPSAPSAPSSIQRQSCMRIAPDFWHVRHTDGADGADGPTGGIDWSYRWALERVIAFRDDPAVWLGCRPTTRWAAAAADL